MAVPRRRRNSVDDNAREISTDDYPSRGHVAAPREHFSASEHHLQIVRRVVITLRVNCDIGSGVYTGNINV